MDFTLGEEKTKKLLKQLKIRQLFKNLERFILFFVVVFLLFHIFQPIVYLMLQISLILFLLYLTIFSYRLGHFKNSLDYLNERASIIFLEAYFTRGSKQAHPIHILMQLIKLPDLQEILYRFGVGYRQMLTFSSSSLNNLKASPPVANDNYLKVPVLAKTLAKKRNLEKVGPEILLAATLNIDSPEMENICHYFRINQEDVTTVAVWQTYVSNYKKSLISALLIDSKDFPLAVETFLYIKKLEKKYNVFWLYESIKKAFALAGEDEQSLNKLIKSVSESTARLKQKTIIRSEDVKLP